MISVSPIALVLHVHEQRTKSTLQGGFKRSQHNLKIGGFFGGQVGHTGHMSASRKQDASQPALQWMQNHFPVVTEKDDLWIVFTVVRKVSGGLDPE